jgi:hypothetical protein
LYERNGFVAGNVITFGPEAAEKEGIPTETSFDIVFFVKPLCASLHEVNVKAKSTKLVDQQHVLDKKAVILRYEKCTRALLHCGVLLPPLLCLLTLCF